MPRSKDPELEQQRRTQIMTTVALCLAAGSHRALTLDRVAQLAGVSKGMVTYYFKTKDRLIIESMQHFLDSQVERMLAIVRSERPVRERLETLIEAALPSREQVTQELNFQTEVWSYGKENPQAFEAIRAVYARFREACQQMVEVGIAEGYVTAPDAPWLYVLLHALIDGVSLQVVMDDSLDLDDLRARILGLIDTALTS